MSLSTETETTKPNTDSPDSTLPEVPEYDKQRLRDLDFDDPRYSSEEDGADVDAEDDESLPSLGEDEEGEEEDGAATGERAANKNPADVSSGEGGGKPADGGGFTDDLLARAAYAGINPEQAKGFSSPASLRDTVRFLEANRQNQPPPQGGQQSPAQKPAEPPKLEDLTLDLDDFDEAGQAAFKKVADHFGKLKSHYEGQTQQLGQTVETLKGLIQHQAAERMFDEFDQFVVGLGKNFTDKLGEGDRFSGKISQEQGALRTAILSHAVKLAEGKPIRGYYKAAVNAVLGDKSKELARKEVAEKLKKRSGSSVSRPTNRQSRDDHRTPEERAIANLRARRKERGDA